MKISVMKGGAWKNSEDEILKAAVMKYGKTEWARVASLLPRKSAKHCKARWEEWLDPRIKKTEWTREEDEKLMHLSKVLSGQWRTISSIMDRTAFQCCERYEKLLDMASREEGQEEDEDDDPRLLRSGEIDPHPESRPARPDPIDMDEDEKEMLQEARARLANTRGKKAKRKMREREMELSRRLSNTQKRRELKAAGIEYIRKRLQLDGEMDYNAEIPFQKEIPAGYYDISNEIRDTSVNKHFTSEQVHIVEHNERVAAEEKRRKADIRRFNQLTQEDLPAAMMQLNRLENRTGVTTKRGKLNLPAPVVSEQEINAIVSGNAALEAVEASRDGSLTSNLLTATPATPNTMARTPLPRNVVMEEAYNQRVLKEMPTPLAGGESMLHETKLFAGTGYAGVTPSTGAMNTPSTPFTPSTPGLLHATPKAITHVDPSVIRQQLASLPAPQNEYEASLPEEELTMESDVTTVEDAEEIERQIREEEAALEREELARRSEVMKRDLPRGSMIASRFMVDVEGAERLLREEMNAIMRYEDYKYPTVDSSTKYTKEVSLDVLSREDRMAAEMMILEEAEDLKSAVAERTADQLEEEYGDVWENLQRDLAYDPEEKRVIHLKDVGESDRVRCLQHAFKSLEKLLSKQTKLVQKSEKKVNVLLGGYITRQKNLLSRLQQLHRDTDMSRINFLCFSKLARHEQKMLALRMKMAKESLKKEKERHSLLQKRYKELLSQLE
ncbi:hypothetical protein WA171_003015 [Blastocystis sp. BT1]